MAYVPVYDRADDIDRARAPGLIESYTDDPRLKVVRIDPPQHPEPCLIQRGGFWRITRARF